MFIRVVVHVFQYLQYGHCSLAEPCNDEWPIVVSFTDEEVERLQHVIHGLLCSLFDDSFVFCQESVDGSMPIEGRIESVSWSHILLYAVYFDCHVFPVRWVPDVGVVSSHTLVVCPVLFPCRNDIEDVCSCIVFVVIHCDPHVWVVIVWFSRYDHHFVRRCCVERRSCTACSAAH